MPFAFIIYIPEGISEIYIKVFPQTFTLLTTLPDEQIICALYCLFPKLTVI